MSVTHILFIQSSMNFPFSGTSLPVTAKNSPRVTPHFNRQSLRCPVTQCRSLPSGPFCILQPLHARYAQCESINPPFFILRTRNNNKNWDPWDWAWVCSVPTGQKHKEHPLIHWKASSLNQVAKDQPCCSLQEVPSGTRLFFSSTSFPWTFCTFSHWVIFLLYPLSLLVLI